MLHVEHNENGNHSHRKRRCRHGIHILLQRRFTGERYIERRRCCSCGAVHWAIFAAGRSATS